MGASMTTSARMTNGLSPASALTHSSPYLSAPLWARAVAGVVAAVAAVTNPVSTIEAAMRIDASVGPNRPRLDAPRHRTSLRCRAHATMRAHEAALDPVRLGRHADVGGRPDRSPD